jgi:hypothetical protein
LRAFGLEVTHPDSRPFGNPEIEPVGASMEFRTIRGPVYNARDQIQAYKSIMAETALRF